MNEPETKQNQLAAIPERKVKRLYWLLALALILFVLGVFLPMLTISKFIFISHSFSVISGVIELLRNGQLLLFLVVVGFSIVMPVLKFYVLFKLLSRKLVNDSKTRRYLHLMHEYGRWAMLDVMVVAVLIVTVKLGAVVSIQVHSGLYVFGSAVLLIMLITQEVVRLTKTHIESG